MIELRRRPVLPSLIRTSSSSMQRARGAALAALLLSAAAGWHAIPAARRRGGTPVATLHSPFPAPGGMGSQMTTPYPVKVMVFIDGTWLYYSIHGRRPGCPVTKKYGVGWELSHSVAFNRLAYLISHHLHTQLLEQQRTNRSCSSGSARTASWRSPARWCSPRRAGTPTQCRSGCACSERWRRATSTCTCRSPPVSRRSASTSPSPSR